MGWLTEFPAMNTESLRALKKAIDGGFRAFTRTYGDTIESLFFPVKYLLIHTERFMIDTPWPIIILGIAAIAWIASRSPKIVAGTIIALLLIG